MDKKNKNPNVPNLRFSSFADPFRIYTLKEVLQRISFPVTVDENKLYYQIGIRSHSKGIFYKEAEIGKQIGNKRIFWIEPNCLILNIVFAWEQAVAKTSEKEVGMVASHRFPMYKVLNNSLDYIVDFFKTEKGKQLLQMASPGGAGRNKTLNQDFFLNSKIYLPSLNEQLKTTELIELIEDRIETQIKIINDYKLLKRYITKSFIKQKGTSYLLSEIAELGRGRVISSAEISKQKNPIYPVYSSQTSNNGVMGYLDNYDYEGEYITWTTDGANAGTVYYRNGKFNCTNVCGILKIKNGYDAYYISNILNCYTKKYVSTNLANPKLMNNVMANIKINLPSIERQKYFSNILKAIEYRIKIEQDIKLNLVKQKVFLLKNMFL